MYEAAKRHLETHIYNAASWEEFCVIDKELALYRQDLAARRRLLLANKMDMPQAAENLHEFKQRLAEFGHDYPLFEISALTGEGLRELMYQVFEILQTTPLPVLPDMQDTEDESLGKLTKVVAEPEFVITQAEPGVWQVTGKKLEKLVVMTDWEYEASLRRLQNILTKIGLDAALREAGAQDGDLVQIAGREFDYAE